MMKRQITLSLLALTCLPLAACQTATSSKPQKIAVGQTQDFMTTGRGLSDGRVDLFQPGTDFLPTEQYPVARSAKISPIPGNTNIIVNDPSVTIYSLDTIEISEPAPAPLPPLQPPVSLSGDYPSPFDQNGNPTR